MIELASWVIVIVFGPIAAIILIWFGVKVMPYLMAILSIAMIFGAAHFGNALQKEEYFVIKEIKDQEDYKRQIASHDYETIYDLYLQTIDLSDAQGIIGKDILSRHLNALRKSTAAQDHEASSEIQEAVSQFKRFTNFKSKAEARIGIIESDLSFFSNIQIAAIICSFFSFAWIYTRWAK